MTHNAPRILVVDDEPQIHRFLGPALEAAGFAPLRALSAGEGLRQAAERSPDLILLDLGLPDMDGIQAIPRLRAFSSVPIVILSARDREAEKIAALDAGADDYVEKPFALGELLARLRALLRRVGTPATPAAARLRAGPLEIDFAERVARLDDHLERAGVGHGECTRRCCIASFRPPHSGAQVRRRPRAIAPGAAIAVRGVLL
jgi:two-component system KDP operon response regulator KdpE